jgi:hypothetical protein
MMGGLGCATITYATEVIRNQDDSHRVLLTLDIEIDAGVYAALQQIDPTITGGVAPAGAQSGWEVAQAEGGRKVTMRREFASLEEIQQAPAALASLLEDPSASFIEATAVQVREVNSDTLEYEFTATVIVPQPEPPGPAPQSGDAAGPIPDLDEVVAAYPELQAALAAAGPAKLVVEVTLPGMITMASLNGDSGGEFPTADRVRWTLSEDKPGTYAVRVVSRQGAATDPVEDLLQKALRDDTDNREFLALLNSSAAEEGAADSRAMSVAAQLIAALPDSVPAETAVQIGIGVAKAAYISFFEDENGKPRAPAVHAAMPIILRLAVKAGNDEEALVAMNRLLDLLLRHDMQQLREAAPASQP